ncbi:hypothetical protein GCM10023238_15680 [Streptomyces heliomycini]
MTGNGTLVLGGAAGHGKTTLVPLALWRDCSKAGPQRGWWSPSGGIAARARTAGWRGCWARVGGSVGIHRARGAGWWGGARAWRSSRPVCSLQRLQRDQAHLRVDVEGARRVHERHIWTGHGAAFLWDVREDAAPGG